MTLAAGTRLGAYDILALLGGGGMGEVYKARDTRLDRIVAIKVLPAHIASDPDLRQRFEREARAVAAVNHPHICTLHDVGRQDGTDFLVMEYLEGETLADKLAKGPLPVDQSLRCAIEIADALDKAHRQRITHRDLKPGNIMLTKAGAKLLDFGLAKTTAPVASGVGLSMLPTSPPVTAPGTILGTFQYMAPEQLEGREADARTDLFAFGAVLYEMLTGKKAFDGKSAVSLMGAILKDEPPSISQVQAMAPPALDRVVRTCLAKDPDDRWQSARDLVRELKWIGEAPTTGAAVIRNRPLGREKTWMTAGAVMAVAGLVSVVWALRVQSVSRATSTSDQLIQFSIEPPPGLSFPNTPAAPQLVVSPDGRQVAFTAGEIGAAAKVWVRS